MKKRHSFFFIHNNMFSILVYFFILKKFPLDHLWPFFLFFNSVMFDLSDVTFEEQINE